jgi:hypothetical protein
MLAALVAPGAPAQAAGPGTAWSIERTPGAVVANGGLAADACPGPDRCVAVGSSATSAGTSALAESWNGTTWSIQHVPMPPGGTHSALDAVSCSSASACTAVGYYTSNLGSQVTLAERWNGSAWSVQPTPVPPGAIRSVLAGVSCGSASSCVAVGGYEGGPNVKNRLVYSWNGARWALVEASSPPGAVYSFLAGVSCTAPTACVAVGNELSASSDDIVTLAQALAGGTWTVRTVPNPAGAIVSRLYGVSCSSPTACTAVGASIQGARRSGASRRRPGRGRGGQGGTAASGAPLAATLAEAWNGTTWSIQATPNPVGTAEGLDLLVGVSCQSAASCTAVGSSAAGGSNTTATLGEAWNGTAWSIVAIPAPTRFANALAGVSCGSAACTTVGYFRDGSGTHQTLAEASAGSGWTVQPTPNPPGAVPSFLVGVSCGAPTACTAVGLYDNSPGTSRTLAETWNGTAWRIQRTPDPPGLRNDSLVSVSCSAASACMAVGKVGGPRAGATLAESWNGTSWTIRPVPTPPTTFAELSGVSCASPPACTAVGYYRNSVGQAEPLAESWNGTTWRIQPVPSPAGGTDFTLDSVSCTAAAACTAVGSYNIPGSLAPLAERWNGKTWAVQATPAIDGNLNGVSCGSATACVAVGDSLNFPVGIVALAMTWRDGTWKLRQTPFVPGAFTALNGAACRSPGACAAVGGYHNGTGLSLPLAEAWNGTAWTLQTAASPRGGTGSTLAGVTVGQAAGFTAVGNQLNSAQVARPLAETGPG